MRLIFSTPEIFERVLLNLDIRELLFAQLVHTHFKRFIEESKAIQQKLFFAPDPTRPTPELHPILKARFPGLVTLKLPKSSSYLYELDDIICKEDWYTDEFYRDRMLREDASWRRMFPVQPPAKLESIKIFTHEFCCLHQLGRCVPARIGSQYQHLQDEGIQMGLLYDLVMHLNYAGCCPNIYLHWQMFLTEPQGNERYDPEDWPGFEALYIDGQDPAKTKNSLTLYYQHEPCGPGPLTPALQINSPFVSKIEEDPIGLLEFSKKPELGWTHWGRYLTPERRAQLERRSTATARRQ